MPKKPASMKSIIVDKIASVTQACALSHELRISGEIPCEEGIVLAVEILTNKSQYNTLELTSGRMASVALGAEKLILCTGAPGILEHADDPRSLVSYTDLAGLKRLEQAGSLGGGMLPKATAIEAAIRGGVRRVHVISYNARDSVLAEVFTNEGTGTMIVADVKALTLAEQHPEGERNP